MQFLNCKVRYLTSQKEWLSKQCAEIDQLNFSIRDILKKQQVTLNDLQTLRIKIKTHIRALNNNLQKLNSVQNDNYNKSQQFYNLCRMLFENYEIKLKEMNDLVMRRQKSLQSIELENKKLSEKAITTKQIDIELMDQEIQNLIKGYSPYPYIIEHYQTKYLQLQQKHKQYLPNKLFNPQTDPLNTKRSSNKKQIHPDLHTTIFQKATLCLKKKQYSNSIRQNHINQLKSKIYDLSNACSRIQKSLDEQKNNQFNNDLSNQQPKFQLSNISKIDLKTIMKEQDSKMLQLFQKDMSILEGIGNLSFVGNRRFVDENQDRIPILFQ